MARPDPVATFKHNLTLVEGLLTFDQLVLQLPISHLERISKSQDTAKLTNPRLRVDGALKHLKNARDNNSLKPHYEAMFNQCVVLAVSYFNSAVRELFIARVSGRFASEDDDVTLFAHDLTIGLHELRARGHELPLLIGERLADGKDISFQDMQSIGRAFKRYLGYEPPRNATVNDIILGQAARHAIVHAGAKVDARLLTQIRDASPRRLKPSLKQGDSIQFDPDEVRGLSRAMTTYLDALAAKTAPGAV